VEERIFDPVFEQLKADILKGVESGNQGKRIPEEQVWKRFGLDEDKAEA